MIRVKSNNVTGFKRVLIFLVSVLITISSTLHPDYVVHAEGDKLVVKGTPTVYVQSGSESIVSIKVENISGADIKGVNLAHAWLSEEQYGTANGFSAGSSEYTSQDPDSEIVDTFYRFSSYFNEEGYNSENATWSSSEEGYTIKANKTATLWFKVKSNYENTGTYNEWIRFGNVHTELAYGIIPIKVLDEYYSGECAVKVNVYNPTGAQLTVGTSDNGAHDITTISLGKTIDFGTVDLSKNTGLIKEVTYYTRNTSTGYNGDITKDNHGNTTDIKVDLSVEVPRLLEWSYIYPFGCNTNLMNGMSWAPLKAAPMTANSWSAAQTGITLNATNFIGGTYTATFRLTTVPHGVKVNGSSIHKNGIYEWPVTVKFTGTNPRIPKAPTNIVATAGNNQVQLTWKAASDAEERAEYSVYRREGTESEDNRGKLKTAQFNWNDYEYIGNDLADDDGNCLFVDGTAKNNKTYTYVVIGGTPYQAYPEISSSVTPKSTYNSKILAVNPGGISDAIGGVNLSWEMNDVYGGYENDGSSLVDHFNIYRDGVLVAQVDQAAVIAEPTYGWAPLPDDPNSYTYRYLKSTYSWETLVEVPIPYQEYSWQIAPVSKSGVEGYLSEVVTQFGFDDEDIAIINHQAAATLNGTVEVSADLEIRHSFKNTIIRVDFWRNEGTTAPDTTKNPYKTNYSDSYADAVPVLEDKNVQKGKTYTYTARATDNKGNVSNDYTFKVIIPSGSDWYNEDYSSAYSTWQVLDGTRVKFNVRPDTKYDDNGQYYYYGTYRIYRNNKVIHTYKASGQNKGPYTFIDDPQTDGTYVYRVDVEKNGMTIKGREYTFVRNTAPVDPGTLLQKPSAPILTIRMSEGNPILYWIPTDEGGKVDGYHIYRKDAGKFVNGTYQNYYGYDAYFSNMRYISIADPKANVLADVYGYYDDNDYQKGHLQGISWDESECPHEYWITAYNSAGESAPSEVFTFDYQGIDENEWPIVPTVGENNPPLKPTIKDMWVEWEDYSDSMNYWDDGIYGSLHVSWEDDARTAYSITKWEVEYSNLYSSYYPSTVYAHNTIKDPQIIEGKSSASPTNTVTAEFGEYGDYDRLAKATVKSINEAGSAISSAKTKRIVSFPRFRALADNKSAKLEWTDLYNDTTTVVNSWEIWRKKEFEDWVKVTALNASSLNYELGDNNQARTDKNGVKNYTYLDTNLDNGWNYEYKVVAKCGDNLDRESVVREVTPALTAASVAPSAPRNLTYKKDHGEIVLSWDKPATGSAQHYGIVYEETNNGYTYWALIDTVHAPATTYVFAPSEATTRRYAVYAYSYINDQQEPQGASIWDSEDLYEVYPSASNIVSINMTKTEINQQAKTNPGAFTANATSSDESITLNWTKSSGATFYEINRSSYDDLSQFYPVLLPSTATSYVDNSVLPGTVYFYTVTASNSYGRTYQNPSARTKGQSKDELAVEPIKEMIESLPQPSEITFTNYQEYEATVNAINEAYANLTDQQKTYITSSHMKKLDDVTERIKYIKLNLQYAAAAEPVQALIDALPNEADITINNLDEIIAQAQEARSAYDGLVANAKKIVDTTRLLKAESRINTLIQYRIDYEAVEEVIVLIEALVDVNNINEFNVEAVKNDYQTALDAYDALEDNRKSIMQNDVRGSNAIAKLNAINNKIIEVEEAIAEQERIDNEAAENASNVLRVISSISRVTLDDKAVIENARSVYDALTPKQKTLVDSLLVSALENAVNKILALEEAEQVIIRINALSLETLSLDDKTELVGIRNAYDNLSVAAKECVSEADVTLLESLEALMVALEERQVDLDAAAYVEVKIDELDDSLTRLNEMMIVLTGEEEITEEDLETIIDEIDAIETSINEVGALYNGLTSKQKGLVNNAAKLSQLEQTLGETKTALNNRDKSEEEIQEDLNTNLEAANAVKELINAIDISNINELDATGLNNLEAQIIAARDAYNALTPEAKALVDNIDHLYLAEQALSEVIKTNYEQTIEDEQAKAIDIAKAQEVNNAIANLPSEEKLKPQDKPNVEAARNLYEALTDTQKALVDEQLLQRLISLEKKLTELALPISVATITVSNQKYTGKEIKVKPQVKHNGKTLVEGKDYTLSYKNNTKVGTARVIITGINGYTDKVEKTFTIYSAIKLNKTSATIGTKKVGKYVNTLQLKATVTSNNKAVKWTSSNSKIAKVDKNGKVTAVSDPNYKGSTVTITATTSDGKKATCKVTVEDPINAFVRRLYKYCLNRNPDKTGFNYWTSRLRSKKITAAEAVKGFFDSKEMKNMKLSNAETIERCYLVMMDRKSDKGGKEYWIKNFKKYGKTYVLKGFVESKEFTQICKNFNVAKGTIK